MPGCLFSLPTPWHVKKITSPPSCVKRRRTRKKNGGWVRVRVSRLSASRLALKEHGLSGNTLKVLKSSTYNMHFKSHLVLRVLA